MWGLSKISSDFTLHLIKVGKLKRFKKVSSDLKTNLRGGPFNSWVGGGGGARGGGVIFKKKKHASRLSEEKNYMQHKCNRKLMGKKGKKYPAHQIARKKILDDQKSHPLPPSRVKWSAPYDRLNWFAVTCGFLRFEKGETCQSVLIMLRGKIALS